MMVQRFTVGRFSTNCYVVGCEETKASIIIDPGFDDRFEFKEILKLITEKFSTLKFIVNTHGHPDHICGNGKVKQKFHVPILIHEYDAYMLKKSSNKPARFFDFEFSSPPADSLLHNEDIVRFGKTTLKVMHTPGHSRGSISLVGEEEVFTGDTLFAGSIGRTDFPESSEYEVKVSLRKLANLPDHLIVYPGHGPTTTISEEKRSNLFLQTL